MESSMDKVLLRRDAFYQRLLLASLLVVMTSSLPLQPQSSLTSSTWVTASQARQSHLMMWLITEKQLIPRVTALAESAQSLLSFACGQEGKLCMEDCLEFASSLPDFPGLHPLPSQSVLMSEKKRQLVQVLMENALLSLEEVQELLVNYVLTVELQSKCHPHHTKPKLPSEICYTANYLRRNLDTTVSHYKNMMPFLYKTNTTSRAAQHLPVNVEMYLNEQHLAIKSLYVAVDLFNQISAVLEYSVELSWLLKLDSLHEKHKGAKKLQKKS